MFGREALFPLEAEKEVEQGTVNAGVGSMDYDYDYVKKIFEKQSSIFGTADIRIKESQEKQKENYLKRMGITKCNFKNGEMVLRRNTKQKTSKGSKQEDRWLGPYTIAEFSKTNCVLL